MFRKDLDRSLFIPTLSLIEPSIADLIEDTAEQLPFYSHISLPTVSKSIDQYPKRVLGLRFGTIGFKFKTFSLVLFSMKVLSCLSDQKC